MWVRAKLNDTQGALSTQPSDSSNGIHIKPRQLPQLFPHSAGKNISPSSKEFQTTFCAGAVSLFTMIVTRYMLSACFFSAFAVTATPIHTPTQRLPRVLPGLPSDSLSVRDTPVSATLPSAIQVRDASEDHPLHTPTWDNLIIPVEARITGEIERRTGDSVPNTKHPSGAIKSGRGEALGKIEPQAVSKVIDWLSANHGHYKKIVSGWSSASEWVPSREQKTATDSIRRWEDFLAKSDTQKHWDYTNFRNLAEGLLKKAMEVTETDFHPKTGYAPQILLNLSYSVLDMKIGDARDLYENLLTAAFHLETKWILSVSLDSKDGEDIAKNLRTLKRYSMVFGTRPHSVVPS
ncbi:hypothetical protein H0H93_012841 [Arthromyces matolae]|nr:hypothetical protein H0H93_012841 [Arthromyces matolae]